MNPLILAALLSFNEPLHVEEPLLSVGTIPKSREIISLSMENSPLLEKHFSTFISLHEGLTGEKEWITATCQYIREEILDLEKCNMFAVAKAVDDWEGTEEIPLDYFVEKKTAVCRHTTLFAVYFLQRLKENGVLQGTIYPIRQNIPRGPHAWCLFAGKETMWHIDPLWGFALPARDLILNRAYGTARMIPNRKKVLFFDLGGVMVNFDFEKMCAHLGKALNISPQEVKEGLTLDFERGKEDPFSPLIEETFPNLFSIKPEMVDLLKKLKKEGATLWVLSNTVDAHFQFLKKHFDFLDLFDGYVLSYQVGARKPEEKIYEFALEAAGVNPEDAAYIDDIPDFVEAAKRKGIDSHPFTNLESLSPALKQWGFTVE